MNPIFKKLNFKDQKQIYVIAAPASFKAAMSEMEGLTQIKTSLASTKGVAFILAFVTRQKEVDDIANKIASLAEGDSAVWFAYPKQSSKKYTCEFNRDNGWAVLGKQGFEPVRMIAIDEDWSALRFRRAEHIKTMARSSAISETGKKRVASAKKSSSKK